MGESLYALLDDVGIQVRQRPTDLLTLHGALTRLVEFLASDVGRTPVNCQTAGAYFSSLGFLPDEPEWAHLPSAYQAILWDMGAQLDDTFSAPAIAANFESTPEQLLARLRALDPSAGT